MPPSFWQTISPYSNQGDTLCLPFPPCIFGRSVGSVGNHIFFLFPKLAIESEISQMLVANRYISQGNAQFGIIKLTVYLLLKKSLSCISVCEMMKKFHDQITEDYIFLMSRNRKQFMVSSILPKSKQKITILSIFSLGNTQENSHSG